MVLALFYLDCIDKIIAGLHFLIYELEQLENERQITISTLFETQLSWEHCASL